MRTATLALLVAILTLTAGPASAGDTVMVIDKEKKSVSIPCKIAPRKINDPSYPEIYPIEVIATWPWHKDKDVRGQKAHETVVVIDRAIKPSAVQKALEQLGLKPGKPAYGIEVLRAEGPEVRVYLEVLGADGSPQRLAIEKTLVDKKTNKPMPTLKWHFTGSAMKKPNPEKDETVYGADTTGTFIALFPVTNDTVFQTSLTMKEEPLLKLDTNKAVLPKEGTPVKLVIEVK